MVVVREKQVATGAEAERDPRVEPLVRVLVERCRLACEPAGDARTPLPPHAAGLHPGGAGTDRSALEDGDTGAASLQLAGDREADDARADDRDVEAVTHRCAGLRASPS